MGYIFYIMGKSASGKDHIYEALLKDETIALSRLVLYTTRPMREREREGREYHFVDENQFLQMEKAGLVIERREYHTVKGLWIYFTAADQTLDLSLGSYLGIGTLESYLALKAYYGDEVMRPIYLEVEDGERLSRALKREKKQPVPDYEEMCRRFLADQKDFSEEMLRKAGIGRRFQNVDLEDCVREIATTIRSECRSYK